MTPALRQSLTWTGCLAAGYAAAYLSAEAGIANVVQSAGLWGARFWIRFGFAVAVSLCCLPLFLRLARRPGFLDGVGRHLTPALLMLGAVAIATALLAPEDPAGLHLVAALVGARLS